MKDKITRGEKEGTEIKISKLQADKSTCEHASRLLE